MYCDTRHIINMHFLQSDTQSKHRSVVSQPELEMIVHALILSLLEDWNSLLTCKSFLDCLGSFCTPAADQVQQDDSHHSDFMFFILASI